MQDGDESRTDTQIQDPPTTLGGILSKLGPGLIIAGSIVGSGELIATTSTGAKAGFSLLWLILIGCIIKVFVQVELGRYTVTTGTTSIKGLSKLPGPRFGKGNWFIWYWFIMFVFVMGQLGGIVGGVGQAISISMPITEYGKIHNEYREAETVLEVARAHYAIASTPESRAEISQTIIENEIASVRAFSQLTPSTEGSPLPPAQGAENLLRPLLNTDLSPAEQFITDQLLPDSRLRVAAELQSSLDLTTSDADLPKTDPMWEIQGRLYTKQDLDNESGNQINAATVKSILQGAIPQASERQKYDWRIMVARTGLLTKASDYVLSSEGISDRDALLSNVESFMGYYNELFKRPAIEPAQDHIIYAALLTVITIALLVIGKYTFIQTFSTVLVAMFTLVTILNVCGLQTMDAAVAWKIQWSELKDGLSFGIGPGDWKENLGFALATFGIIGVGAAELIAYPYWCMEHGYAKFTGPRDETSEWGTRARGWIKVLQWDAWCSAAVYTFATIAFYLLGAAILNRINLMPAGDDMVRSLSVMYRPVFGVTAESIFLFGAVAVLYSTFFVATAGNARMLSDVFRTLGWIADSDKSYLRCVKWLCAILPAICGFTYILGVKPVVAVIMSGVMQSIMLPMLGGAAIYFRYKFGDDRVRPRPLSDIMLMISAFGLLVAGGFAAYTKLFS